MRYPVLLMASLASTVLLTACNKSDQTNPAAAARPQMPPTIVNTQPVRFETVPLTKELSGKTVAYREAVVTPQVSGIIERQLFEEGRFVKQGQPLYQINSDNYNSVLAGSQAELERNLASVNTAKASYNNALASLESRQAELALARTNYNRLAKLRGSNAISNQELDASLTQVQTAEAAVKNAQAQVGVAKANIEAAQAASRGAQQAINNNQLNVTRTIVRAPISGVTSRSAINVGGLAAAGQTQMLTISQLNPIYVDISQSSAELLALRQAYAKGNVSSANSAQVQLILADGSTYPIIGQLRFEEAKVDPNTGTVNLRAVFPNANSVLLPGMLVNARIIQGVINNAVLLPQSAIVRTAKGDTTVNIVDANSQIQVRPVTVEGTYNGQWIVTSGLQAGEQVVIIGGAKVKPDQKVIVKPLSAASATANTASPTTTNRTQAISNAPVKATSQPNTVPKQ